MSLKPVSKSYGSTFEAVPQIEESKEEDKVKEGALKRIAIKISHLFSWSQSNHEPIKEKEDKQVF
jgi:hypothetical protein